MIYTVLGYNSEEKNMKIVYAHEKLGEDASKSIFLAGPSPRNDTHCNWRPVAIEILKSIDFKGVVFVPLPRDGLWLPNYDAQVEWELEYLEKASVIVFWIPRNLDTLPAFTTNIEFGMYVKTGKITLGFPEDTPKMKYLAYVGNKYSVPIHHILKETLQKAVSKLRTN